MSSSLSSVILIGVVWLLIITTLFVRRHSPVRRTSKALSETRVVHEGGTGIDRSRRRPLPAESLYHADPDADLELVEAEPEQVVIDDTRDDTADIVPPLPVPSVVEGDVVEYRTQDDVDTGEFAPVGAETVGDLPDATVAEDDEVVTEDGGLPVDGDAETGNDADDAQDAEDTEDTEDAEDTEVTALAAVVDHPTRRFAVVDDAYIRGGDIEVSVGTDDVLPVGEDAVAGADGDHGSLDVSDDVYGSDDEVTEDDIDYVAARQGRGIYNPVVSRRLAEQRQGRRRRVLMALVAVTVLSLIGAVALTGALWTVTVLGTALTAMYLYTLRKQTLAERELQHRRLARMRRARLGVRNTDDRELGVPDRLRRPGAVVVESDDADPEFAALEYADVTFAGVDDVPDMSDTADDRYGRPGDGQPTVRVV